MDVQTHLSGRNFICFFIAMEKPITFLTCVHSCHQCGEICRLSRKAQNRLCTVEDLAGMSIKALFPPLQHVVSSHLTSKGPEEASENFCDIQDH